MCPYFHNFGRNETELSIRFFDFAHTLISYQVGNVAAQYLNGPGVVAPQKKFPRYPRQEEAGKILGTTSHLIRLAKTSVQRCLGLHPRAP